MKSVEEMMDINRKTKLGQKGIIDTRSFTMVASSRLPPTGPFQVWKKPYFMFHGGASSSGTKPYFGPPDGPITPVSEDDKNKKTQNPSPLPHEVPTSGYGVESSADGSSVKTEPKTEVHIKWGRKHNPNIDPKRLKRILSNRVSAQKSRMKKLQYMGEMERQVRDLKAEISVLSPQVTFHTQKHKLLIMEKDWLNKKVSESEDDKILKESLIDENKSEVNRLMKLYMQQQQLKQGQTWTLDWEPELEQTATMSLNQSEPQQVAHMNSNVNQSEPQQMVHMNSNVNQSGPQQMVHMTSNQEGIEQILNFNSLNLDPAKHLS